MTNALETIAAGGFVLVVDRDAPDSLGMLVVAGEHADAEHLQRLSQLATGWSYLALTDERCERLGLQLVAARDDDLVHAPVTVTIQAREGVGGGVGLTHRARTIAVAIDPETTQRDIRFGGHVLPLRGRPGGLLERAGPTEAALDLTRMAGLNPSAVLGEVLNGDGSPAQGDQLTEHARRHGLPVVTIGDLIAYRRRAERLVERQVATTIATRTGEYLAVGYLAAIDHTEHMAMVRGEVTGERDVLVYMHLACWEGDVFGSRACECRARLDAAEAAIGRAGRGVIVHLASPAYFHHQERAHDDQLRDFGIGAQILADLGLSTIRVLSDRARPLPGLEGYGLSISGHAPLLGAR